MLPLKKINLLPPRHAFYHLKHRTAPHRMKERGDTGQIKRAEDNMRKLNHLHAKVDAVMRHLEIPPVLEPEVMEKRP